MKEHAVMIMRNTFWLFCCAIFLSACGASGKKGQEEASGQGKNVSMFSDKPTEVRAKPIFKEVFHYELISNGTVQAGRKADLKFQGSEVVTRIYVKNGQRVRKGEKLASLDVFKLKNALVQARDNFERAKLDLQDILIGQGYALADQGNIPEQVLKIAKVKSSYDQSRINMEIAEYNLNAATLYAPFEGVVANLFAKENNYPSGSDAFCTVVDLDHPEIRFMILEGELSMVQKGESVLVSPFSAPDKVYKGIISEVNPLVDKNGMVSIKAVLSNPGKAIYEGMNVRVRVQRTTDKQLLVPKSALVLRNNRKVVFTSKNGQAQWVYVQTSLENSESYVVTEGLHEGDSVIYEGNLNLAHESPIVVLK
jgi:membrane fusion protein, multidrug efflux system